MAAAASAVVEPARRRRIIVAGIAGNVMEWYDFAVYGYFAVAIGVNFFPAANATASLIAAFGAFAAGFLMRPLGGLVFGYMADRLGRKPALLLSVAAMAVPTVLIGLLPGHATIGLAAPILVVFLRMIQGLSVGGEYTCSAVFLVETAPPDRRGLAGSWAAFGAISGILLGSGVGAVVTALLSADAVQAWGWRIPFLFGLGVGAIGLAIRRHLPESQPGRSAARPAGSPLLEAARSHWRDVLLVFALCIANGVTFYTMFVYAVTYLKQVVHVSAAKALDINTFNMLVMAAILPLAGLLSDRIGRRPVMLAATAGLVLLSWPLLWLMHHADMAMIVLGQLGFAVLFGLFCGATPTAIAEAFPAAVRCSAVSVGYNLSLALFGGTAPLVATYLIARTGDDLSPAYYMMAAAAISLAAISRMPETVGRPLR